MKQMSANQCWPRTVCSQSIHTAARPGANDFQVFVCRCWKWKRRKCHVEKREHDAVSLKRSDERLKLATTSGFKGLKLIGLLSASYHF